MAFLGRGTKNCLCFSFRKIEHKQFRPGSNSNCYQTTRKGLKCSNCNRLICSNFVNQLATSLIAKRNEIHEEFQSFASSIIECSKTGYLKTSNNFIGHCCLINLRCENEHKLKTTLSNNKRATIDEKPPVSFGGSFCLPEFSLLIGNNTNCMDVFALGQG